MPDADNNNYPFTILSIESVPSKTLTQVQVKYYNIGQAEAKAIKANGEEVMET